MTGALLGCGAGSRCCGVRDAGPGTFSSTRDVFVGLRCPVLRVSSSCLVSLAVTSCWSCTIFSRACTLLFPRLDERGRVVLTDCLAPPPSAAATLAYDLVLCVAGPRDLLRNLSRLSPRDGLLLLFVPGSSGNVSFRDSLTFNAGGGDGWAFSAAVAFLISHWRLFTWKSTLNLFLQCLSPVGWRPSHSWHCVSWSWPCGGRLVRMFYRLLYVYIWCT